MSIAIIQKYDITKRSRKGNITINPPVNGIAEWNIMEVPLSLDSYGEYTIESSSNIQLLVKMWGASGGSTGYGTFSHGGGGGFSTGIITLIAGVQYNFIVGEAGEQAVSPNGARVTVSGGGGGASAISFNGTPLIVAGGGGGSGGRVGGAGGGLSGQDGIDGAAGKGASQISPGQGGHGARRGGEDGSGPNGGKGSPTNAPVFSSGGRGYGKGGDGVFFYADGPSGGGGGGYFGGGGGGGDSGGYGGGGGSGYVHPDLVINGSTESGDYDIPARESDVDRGNSGGTINNIGQDGKIIISLS